MERDGRKEKTKDSSSRSRSKAAKDEQKEVSGLPKTVHVSKSKERDQKKDKTDKKDNKRKAKDQPDSGYETESGRSESEYEEDHSSGSCRSDSEESGSEYDEDASNSAASSIRKTGAKEVKKDVKKPSNKRKAEENETEAPKRSKTTKDGEAGVKENARMKNESQSFGDMDVDLDLYHSAPSNVVPMRIKLANNLILTCKNLDQKDSKIAYDYAALTFQRRTGQDKIFEFNLPMSITPRLMSALKAICTKNHKFFKPDGLEDVDFSGKI